MRYIIPPIPDRLSITAFKEFYTRYKHLNLIYSVGGPNGKPYMVMYKVPDQESNIDTVVGIPVSPLEVGQFLFDDGHPANKRFVMDKHRLVANRAYEAIQWYIEDMSVEDLTAMLERFNSEIQEKIKSKKGNI